MPPRKFKRKTSEELRAIAESKHMVAPGVWKTFGFPNHVVPENPTGDAKKLIGLLLESERRVAKKSPYYIAKYIMGRAQRRDGKLWGWNWRHVKLSKQLWWAYETRTERPWGTKVYVEWCRGSRKSTLLQALEFCIALNDPNLTMLVDGDVKKKVAQKTAVVRDLFEDEVVKILWGERGPGPKWKAEEWTLIRDVKTSDPTMMASGLDSSKTGGHYDIIISDDAQTDENCESPTINEDVKKNYRLYESLKSGKVCTVTYIAGTRWGFRDLGADIQAEMEDEIRRGLPRSIFISREAAYIRDKNGRLDSRFATFPEGGLDVGMLKRIKSQQKPALFSYNYLLQPLSEDQATFHSKWVRHHEKSVTELIKEQAKFYLSMDTAGTDKGGAGKHRSSDSTAIVVIAVTTEGDIYVMEARNIKATKLEILEQVIELNEVYPLDGAVGEEYFEGKKIVAWVRDELRKRSVNINWVKFKQDHRSKGKRIEDLQPYAQNGRLWWRKEHTELEDQMLQHPKGDHDDLPDALAQGVKIAIVPKRVDNGPWFKEDDYAETDEYKKLEAEGKAPSYLAVALAQAEYDRANRIQRSGRRFVFPGHR